jgi:hypothetical protein
LLLLCAAAVLLSSACGKRGNPMPPLQRIPAGPTDITVTRIDDDVFVRLTVPSANIDSVRPGDVARVEVYALTLEQDSRVLSGLQPDEVRKLSTLVASETVRPILPPAPPPEEGQPPAPPPPPGVDQGAVVVLREALQAAARAPVTVPVDDPVSAVETTALTWPLGTPLADTAPRRYYYAVAVSSRGRYGPHSGLQSTPLVPVSGPPSKPEITVAETSMTIRWTPPTDVRGHVEKIEGEVLASRSLVPAPAATAYDVYEVSKNASPEGPLAVPVPLTEAPVASTELTRDHATLGTERCFSVRAVNTVDGVLIRGPASPVGCATFADVFAPAAPRDLLAAAVPGAINLIWEASASKDVDSYAVLRGEAGGATLTALATVPAGGLRYRDDAVQSGVRYVYVVIAIDSSGNRSDESNRVEETAR